MAFILARRLQPLRGLVDVVPIVTVVLLLLLFFILGSSFVLQPGIKVDPPRTSYGIGMPSSRLIVAVTLPPPQFDAGGALIKPTPTLYFDDAVVSLDEFRAALDRLPPSRTSPPLVIKSDRDVPLEEIMRIEDIAFAHHLAVVIGTQPETGAP